MFHLSGIISLSSLLSLVSVASSHVAQSPRTLFGRNPIYPTPTAQAYNRSHTSSASQIPSCSTDTALTTAAASNGQPQTYPNYCLIGKEVSGCNPTSTWDGPPIPKLTEQCVLWDSSCPGDFCTAAWDFFSDTLWKMEEKPCWKLMDNASIPCTQYESSDTLSAMRKAKDWMRKPACNSTAWSVGSGNADGCCGTGYILAKNVDVYYWPELEANTACLNVIGNNTNPPGYGATTDLGLTYWGCTAIHPETSTTISDIAGLSGDIVSSTTITIVQSIITTAQMTDIGSITFKQSLVNPWTPPACIGETSAASSSIRAVGSDSSQVFIHVRGHSLLIPSSVTQADGLPVKTVVSGSFTFTSPSIYANFHSIAANDWCGVIGSEATIAQTMLTFSPGELSTIAGPLTNYLSGSGQSFSTKQFDFADLPCPPQSVMEENWYKPQPGEPYRPLIALPSKVKAIDPEYDRCADLFFTAYDPPRTLVPAAAMVSEATTSHIVAIPTSPTPSPSLNIGAKKTAVKTEPTPTPIPMQSTSQLELEQQGGSQRPSGSAPNQQSSATADPGQVPQPSNAAVPKQMGQSLSNLDPKHASPDLMSQIESVLAPGPPNQPTLAQNEGLSITESSSRIWSQQTSGGTLALGSPPKPQNSSPQIIDSLGEPNPQGPNPSGVHLFITGSSFILDPSSVPMDGTDVSSEGRSAISPGTGPIGQSNAITDENQMVHLSVPASVFATTIAGNAIQALPNGVLIHGNTITAGAAPMTISGTPISIDSSNQIYLESTQYQLSTPSPAPATTLANGAVAVPLWNEVSIHGTVTTAGASAVTVSGTAISVDTSNNLVFGSGANSILASLDFFISDASTARQAKSRTSTINQATTALSATLEEAEATLSRGAPAVTVDGLPVSMDSAGGLVVGSETLALASLSGGLGALIMVGLQSGGPSTTEPTSNAGASSATATSIPSASPNIGHTVKGSAVSMKNQFPRKLVAILSLTTICLHI